MRATWLYYDYLRRYGIFILVGLLIGTVLGFAYFQTHPKRTVFAAKATISVPPSLAFNIVSPDFSNAQAAVDFTLVTVTRLKGRTQVDFDPKTFKIEGRHRVVLWKTMAVGTLLGGLLAIGIAFVWNDAMTYERHRRAGETGVP